MRLRLVLMAYCFWCPGCVPMPYERGQVMLYVPVKTERQRNGGRGRGFTYRISPEGLRPRRPRGRPRSRIF